MPKTITGEIIEIDDILLKFIATTKIQNLFKYWDFLGNYTITPLGILSCLKIILSINFAMRRYDHICKYLIIRSGTKK